MKSLFKVTIIAAAVAALSACQKEEPKAVEFTTDAQKQSYSIGASIGTYMSGHVNEQKELGIDVDTALVVRGFEDGLADKLQLTEEQMREVLQQLEGELKDKRDALAAKQAEEANAKGQAFLDENKAKDGVTVTESGLQYEVLTPAPEGAAKPLATDTVEVHYRGTLIDGTEFDSSYGRDQTIKFPLNRVIKGWTEGVQLMGVGSKFRFVIPAELGYGAQDTGAIPPNSVLVFEVELISIEAAEAAAK